MTQIVELKRDDKTRQRTGMVVTGVVVLALVVGAIALSTRWLGADEAAPPAGPSRTDRAVQVASDFFVALDNHDADGMLALMTGDAVTPEWSSRAAVRDDAAWRDAVGWTETQRRCARNGSTGGTVYLRCDFALHALGSDQLGRGPFDGGYWAVHVDRGKVVYLKSELPYGTNGFAAQMWEPFVAFVESEFPGDADRMFGDDGPASTDPAALRLWQQHIADYVAAEKPG